MSVPEPVLPPPGKPNPSNMADLLLITALVFGFAAVVVGVFGVYMAAFPGPCGDNAGPGLGVIASWAVDLPLGLLALGIGCFVRKGSPGMRKACLVTSLVTLALPIIATFMLAQRHC